MARPIIPTPPKTRLAAVEDYRNKLPLKVIAAKHGFTPATISIWAKAAQITRRSRGIQRTTVPSERDRLIIRRARELPINQVAKEFRKSRARVWSIRTYWRRAGWVEPLPWQVGDTVEWAGQPLKVVRIDDEKRGAVRTAAGALIDPFAWKLKGQSVRRVPASLTTG